jgi:hypothetical protein
MADLFEIAENHQKAALGKGAEPVVPTEPTTPIEPTEPVEPTEPTEPVEVPFLEKLKTVAPTEPAAPIVPAEPVAPVTPTEPTELSEDQKLLLKLKESNLTFAELAKAVQITDYSKMSTEDLIRINLEKQYGENGVTAEILEKETLGFENKLPSEQKSYLDNIKITLGQEINYGNEVTKYIDEVLAAKPKDQAPIKTQAEIDAEIQTNIDNATKEDLAAISSTIEKLGIAPDSELATSLLSEYSYERAVGYVKNGKLDAATFLDHTYKILDYENAEKRGYEKGIKEATEKFANPKPTGAGNSGGVGVKSNKQNFEEQINK